MKICPWQERVETAARADVIQPDVRAHIRDCADCRSLLDTIRILKADGLAAERAAQRRVPSARSILAEAGSRASNVPDERAVLWPIIWIERLAVAVVCAGLVSAGFLLSRLDLRASLDLAHTPGASHEPGAVSVLVAALAVLFFAVYGLTMIGDPMNRRI
jgi:hypothetical protein